MPIAFTVYKDLIISTIVDVRYFEKQSKQVYKDLIISTIVDMVVSLKPNF